MKEKVMQLRPNQAFLWLVALLLLAFVSAGAQPNWVPIPNQLYNMQVIGKLKMQDGTFSSNPEDLVAAFVGSECRGLAERVDGNPDLLFLSIGSNLASGEVLTLKAYLADDNFIVNLDNTLSFTADGQTGSVSSPYIFLYNTVNPVITATAGANGTISPLGAIEIDFGGNQSFSIIPATGYMVADVLVDGQSVGAVTQYNFTGVTQDHSIHASFEIAIYWLAYVKWGEGSFIGNTYQYVEYGGDGTPVEVVPGEGHYFMGWDDGVTDNPRTELNVTQNMIIVATLGVYAYELNYSAGANGSLSGQTSQTVYYGQDGTAVTAIPDEHYDFLHWSDQVTDNPRTDENISGPINVQAVFVPETYTITATSGANGTISPNGNVSVSYNDTLVFDFTPAAGYEVEDVLVDDVSVGAMESYAFEGVAENHTIHVSFIPAIYTLTYLSQSTGYLEGETLQNVPYGGSGTAVTAFAYAGYHFDAWSDGKTTNPRVDRNVAGNITVTAMFAINTYTITATAGPNGTITPSGTIIVNEGSSKLFTIVPYTGYKINDVKIDGASIGPVGFYEFTNVTANHTIAATFSIKNYTLTYQSDVNGSLIGDSVQSVPYGGDGTPVEAVPSPGYIFTGWSDGRDSNPRTDLDVSSNINVMAGFSADGPPNWVLPGTLEFNMQLIGVLLLADSSFSIDQNDLVGAFVNGECRGVSSPNPNQDGLVFLTIGSNVYSGETVTFKAYIASQNIIVNLNQTVNFVSLSEIGTLLEPFVFSYTEITYLISAIAGPNGTITPSGNISVPHWSNQGFSIAADTGYYIEDVLIDDESIGAIDTVTFIHVFQNRSIYASFAINTYTISATASENGSIDPMGEIVIDYGTDTLFTFLPDEGFEVFNVIINGDSIGSMPNYLFENVASDQTIHVIFDVSTRNEMRPLEQKIKVFPNPTKSFVQIQLPVSDELSDQYEVMLFGFSGNLIATYKPSTSLFSIDLDGNAAGLYFIKITHQRNGTEIFKVQKI
ncbi:MAG: InlB B-repeat-containing protein [Bacteroidales bacterium]|nr:InlB B-repeat-containing protein [Bacteroidales bacterium]